MLANDALKLGLNNRLMMPLSRQVKEVETPTVLGNWQGFSGVLAFCGGFDDAGVGLALTEIRVAPSARVQKRIQFLRMA